MDAESYIRILAELGFDVRDPGPNNGRLLRHPRLRSRLYFNRNRTIGVYFTSISDPLRDFPARLWEEIPAHQIKRTDHGLTNVVPRTGMEHAAFQALLA